MDSRPCRPPPTPSWVTSTSAAFTVSSLSSPSSDLRLSIWWVPSTPSLVPPTVPRLAMIIGGASYVIVVFCNIWSTPYIQIPANIIVGMGAALIWNAEGVYLARCALHDCSYNGKSIFLRSRLIRRSLQWYHQWLQRCLLLHLPVLWLRWHLDLRLHLHHSPRSHGTLPSAALRCA